MDVGVASMPVIDETGNPISPYMGVQGIHVLKNAAENKKSAVEKVLRALMDPKVEVDLAKASGCAPAMESCYEMDEVLLMKLLWQCVIQQNMQSQCQMSQKWMLCGRLLATF